MSIVSEFTDSNSSSSVPGTCPICFTSGPFSPRPSPKAFRLFDCANCGIVFLFPLPSESELATLYDKRYYGDNRRKFLAPIEAGVAALTRLKWKRLERLLSPGGRLLDIGCGRGTLLTLARASGFEALGIERASPVGHSIPGILYKSLPECNFPNSHFQLVVLWHVLEHLPDPVTTLREIHRILQPRGWLSIAVPNYGGAQAEASGTCWFHLDVPRHFWHFRFSSLQGLLSHSGFRITHSSTFSLEYDWFGTVQSWMSRTFQDENRLYSQLKGELAAPMKERISRLATAVLLAPPAAASVLWDAARGRGQTLTVMAQKLESETGGN